MYSSVKSKIDTIMSGLTYAEAPVMFNIEKLPSSIINKSYFVEFKQIAVDGYFSSNEIIENMIIHLSVGYLISDITSYNTAIELFEAIRDEFKKPSNYVSGTVKTDFAGESLTKWFDTKTNNWLIGVIPLMIVY